MAVLFLSSKAALAEVQQAEEIGKDDAVSNEGVFPLLAAKICLDWPIGREAIPAHYAYQGQCDRIWSWVDSLRMIRG